MSNDHSQLQPYWLRVKQTIGREWPFFLIIVIGLTIHYRAIFSSGPLTAGDWDYFRVETLKEYFPRFAALRTQIDLGALDVMFLVRAPIFWLMGGLAHIGIPFSFSERVFYIIPAAILPGLFSYHLLRQWFQRLPSFWGALVATVSPYWLIRNQSQFSITITDSVLIWLLAEITYAAHQPKVNPRRLLFTGGLAGVLAWHEVRLVPIIAVAIMSYLLFLIVTRQIGGKLIRALFLYTAGSFLLLQLPWLVVLIKNGSSGIAGLASDKVWITFQTLWHALTGTSPFWGPAGPQQFMTGPVPKIFLLLPLIVIVTFLAVFRKEPSKSPFWFFLPLYVVGVAIGKQEASPFTTLYGFLFHHVPLFWLFREGTKFFGLIIVSLAFFVTFGLDRLRSRLTLTRQAISIVFMLGIAVIALISVRPAVNGALGENYNPTFRPEEVDALTSYLNTPVFGRVLWYPIHPQFALETSLHPRIDWVALPKTFQNYSPRLLTEMGVTQIVVPPDPYSNITANYGQSASYVNDLRKLSYLHEESLPFTTSAHVFTFQPESTYARSLPVIAAVALDKTLPISNTVGVLPVPTYAAANASGAVSFPWRFCQLPRSYPALATDEISSPLSPTSLFYPLKRWRENFLLKGQPDDGAKFIDRIVLLRKRIVEYQALHLPASLAEVKKDQTTLISELGSKFGQDPAQFNLDSQTLRNSLSAWSADSQAIKNIDLNLNQQAVFLMAVVMSMQCQPGQVASFLPPGPTTDVDLVAPDTDIASLQIDGQTIATNHPVKMSQDWHLATGAIYPRSLLPDVSPNEITLTPSQPSHDIVVHASQASPVRVRFDQTGIDGVSLWVDSSSGGTVNDNGMLEPIQFDPTYGVTKQDVTVVLRPGNDGSFRFHFERQPRQDVSATIANIHIETIPQLVVTEQTSRSNPVPLVGWQAAEDRLDSITLRAPALTADSQLLVIARAYDRSWQLRLPDGKSLAPVSVDGQMLGFVLPADSLRAGDRINIVYTPGEWYSVGWLVAGAALLALSYTATRRVT